MANYRITTNGEAFRVERYYPELGEWRPAQAPDTLEDAQKWLARLVERERLDALPWFVVESPA